MKKTILLFASLFLYLGFSKAGDIVINSLVVNRLEDNPIGININFYTDDDKTTKAPKKLSEALTEMGVKYLRYPGGDKADHVLFSVPPFDKVDPRPARMGPGADYRREGFMNSTYSGFRHNPLDFDEFMAVCIETGSEPVIVVPADMYKMIKHPEDGRTFYDYNYKPGSKDNQPLTVEENRQFLINHAAGWVNYANKIKNYNVKYWIIGNETEVAYWSNAYGNMSCEAKDYENLIIDFSAAMKAVDSTIEIISNGSAWLVESYLKNPDVVAAIDHICCSSYPLMHLQNPTYDKWANKLINSGKLTDPLDEVLQKIDANPAAKAKNLDVWASEFSSMYTEGWPAGFDLGHALANMDIIGQMLQNPRYGKLFYWNTHWCGSWNGLGEMPVHADYDGLLPNNDLSPRGFTLSMFSNHLYPKIVQTKTNNGVYDGIMTYASRSEDDNAIYLYVINTNPADENVNITVSNRNIKEIKRVAEIYGDNPDHGNWFNGWSWKHNLPSMSKDEAVIEGSVLPLKKYSGTVFHVSLFGKGESSVQNLKKNTSNYFVQNGILSLSDLEVNSSINIYSLQGHILYKNEKTNSEKLDIQLPAGYEIVLLKVNNPNQGSFVARIHKR